MGWVCRTHPCMLPAVIGVALSALTPAWWVWRSARVRTMLRPSHRLDRGDELRLAQNERDPVAKASKTKVLYSFGRQDQLDAPVPGRYPERHDPGTDPAESRSSGGADRHD